MKIAIEIGDARSFSRPESWQITPDDRQEIIKLINGVVVQDYGHIEAGDVFTCSTRFDSKNFEKIKAYWEKRTLVSLIDEAGNSYKDIRVVIKSYSYVERFEKYYNVTLEFWRV